MLRARLIGLLISLLALSVLAGVFSYQPLWEKVSAFRPWTLGLDLAGGTVLTYSIDLSNVGTGDRGSVVEGLRDVIERRVNLFGVSEPRVYLARAGGEDRLVVELAGMKDVGAAIMEIGATPFLEFREVKEVEENGTTTLPQAQGRPEELERATAAFVSTPLTGRYVKAAQVGFGGAGARTPQINLQFNDEGAELFEALTEANVGRPLGIFIDGELLEAPTVQGKIPGGQAVITGSYTLEEARVFVERFNAGALPAPIVLIHQETVSADFGADSLAKAVFAGAIGTLVILLFMLFYYRGLGVFAAASLLMYVALVLAIFKLVPVTMTLAGIAGFILSIGMAVDANILVFERTKEELKKGMMRTQAIEEGFARAWTSIRDSNISTLITAAVLYTFTSSFVQGFALALFVGVVVSMFSAITITRTLMRVFMK
ncbi:MAG: protein translocase subunit SecD [Candidatus Jorgensenbacteria bacterium]|nr:protein translocase subunit SecD [Candidatus Jorgensenbacteria bacterium]